MADLQITFVDGVADLVVRNNDLALTDGLDSDVFISLFTDARAPEGERLPDDSGDRRGWWGDAYADIEGDSDGSLLWLLSREKQTPEVLQRARGYMQKALAHLVTDGTALAVSTEASYPRTSWLQIDVQIDTRTGRRVFRYAIDPQGDAIALDDEPGTPGEIQGVSGMAPLDLPAATSAPQGELGEVHGAMGTAALDLPVAPSPPFGLIGEIGCGTSMGVLQATWDSTTITFDSVNTTWDQT